MLNRFTPHPFPPCSVAQEADLYHCITWASLTSGFWLGLANVEHQQEMGGENKKKGIHSLALPLPGGHLATAMLLYLRPHLLMEGLFTMVTAFSGFQIQLSSLVPSESPSFS